MTTKPQCYWALGQPDKLRSKVCLLDMPFSCFAPLVSVSRQLILLFFFCFLLFHYYKYFKWSRPSEWLDIFMWSTPLIQMLKVTQLTNRQHATQYKRGTYAQKTPRSCACALNTSIYSEMNPVSAQAVFSCHWHAAMHADVLISNSRKRPASDKFLCTRCDKIAYLENWSFSKRNDVVAFSTCLQLHNLPILVFSFCSLS